MPVAREETPHDVGQLRMINNAAFDQPDEAFMVRVLPPTALASAASAARYRLEFDAVV